MDTGVINKIDYIVRISKLNDGRYRASKIGTDEICYGRDENDAFYRLSHYKSFREWRDKQNAEIKEKYPEYFK